MSNYLSQIGDRIRRPKLGETLKKLAYTPNPHDLFYRGEMAKQHVADIREQGGIVTMEDFANYKYVSTF